MSMRTKIKLTELCYGGVRDFHIFETSKLQYKRFSGSCRFCYDNRHYRYVARRLVIELGGLRPHVIVCFCSFPSRTHMLEVD